MMEERWKMGGGGAGWQIETTVGEYLPEVEAASSDEPAMRSMQQPAPATTYNREGLQRLDSP